MSFWRRVIFSANLFSSRQVASSIVITNFFQAQLLRFIEFFSSSSLIYFYFAFISSTSCLPLGRDRGLWVVGGHTQIHITRILIPLSLSHTHTHTWTHTCTHFFFYLLRRISLSFFARISSFFCSSSCSRQILISRRKQTHFHIHASHDGCCRGRAMVQTGPSKYLYSSQMLQKK